MCVVSSALFLIVARCRATQHLKLTSRPNTGSFSKLGSNTSQASLLSSDLLRRLDVVFQKGILVCFTVILS